MPKRLRLGVNTTLRLFPYLVSFQNLSHTKKSESMSDSLFFSSLVPKKYLSVRTGGKVLVGVNSQKILFPLTVLKGLSRL